MNSPMRAEPDFPFDNTYARLPDRFFARLPPTPVPAPRLIRVNEALASQLGLDTAALTAPAGVAVLAGNKVPSGSAPLAMAYAGHQFGAWVPQLGDGRAILLGEVVDREGQRHDVQLKGSGPTPFSRMGDGRAVLGPVLREYIVSEAIAALGIPTTRALAAVTTGEQIRRETLLPGAVLTRVAQSHVRVGTFQYFAARRDTEALRLLADYVIERHYPEVADADQPYLALYEAIIGRQAALVARWMMVGFIHGVMNTDNMSVVGETIDYGPCAFMDIYHPDTVYSSIDHAGRYAFGNQSRVAHWNLACLGQALLPLLGGDEDAAVLAAQEKLNGFPGLFDTAWLRGIRAKLGLESENDDDAALVQELLQLMAIHEADYTLTFRRLSQMGAVNGADDQPVRDLFKDPTALDAWTTRWRDRLSQESLSAREINARMLGVNPAVIPRNHLVEEAIQAAVGGDLTVFESLIQVLTSPFDEPMRSARYMAPPRPEQVVHQTFCGT